MPVAAGFTRRYWSRDIERIVDQYSLHFCIAGRDEALLKDPYAIGPRSGGMGALDRFIRPGDDAQTAIG